MKTFEIKQFVLSIAIIAFITLSAFNCSNKIDTNKSTAKKVLIFTKTAAFYHGSIPFGVKAIQKLGTENNFGVDTTSNSQNFTAAYLNQYAAVVFLNTTGDVLNDTQQKVFESYIKKGGGFVGVHAASDTEYDWPWYGNLVGAYFKNHPLQQQEANLNIVNSKHPATVDLPQTWRRKDEWYNFKWIAQGLNILIKIDESSYQGGENGADHPVAWYHDYDGGRAFYTALGHTDESYSEPLFLKHLLGGIQYAMGKKK